MSKRPVHSGNRQRGAVLIISLLMLMIMTILAISISQTSTLEQRMAGNARDRHAAFAAAEAGLRAGEAALDAAADADTLATGDNLTTYKALEILTLAGMDMAAQNQTWWTNNGVEYGVAGTQNLTEVVEDPRYVISHRATAKDTLSGGTNTSSKVVEYYEITSHAYGLTDTAEAVTSTVIAVPVS